MLRIYGLRSASVFILTIWALAAGTWMVGESVSRVVLGGAQSGYRGDGGPAMSAWLDTPYGIAVTPKGEIYIADSRNDVIRRVDSNLMITTVVGSNRTGFSGDEGFAVSARLDGPEGVAVAPDGDLLVADSNNSRIRRIDKATGRITTIAGSGDSGFDGDDRPATEAALSTPSAVAVASNGDVYIADSLNFRVRMVDHATGLIRTVAGDGDAGETGPVGDGGPATRAHLYQPSDVALAPNGDLYVADLHHNRIRRVDAKTGIITTVAGDGSFGSAGDGGPATKASLAGAAGVALAPGARGALTLYIADYYNGLVRVVGPDGIIHSITNDGREAFGAPARVAYDGRRGGWIYVTDASRNQVVAMPAPHPSPGTILSVRRAIPARKTS